MKRIVTHAYTKGNTTLVTLNCGHTQRSKHKRETGDSVTCADCTNVSDVITHLVRQSCKK